MTMTGMKRKIEKPASAVACCLLLAFMLLPVFAFAQQNESEGAVTIDENAFDAPLILKETGREELAHIENLFQYGDYPAVVTHAEEALRRRLFDSEEEQLKVYRFLGVTYYILQNRPRSKESFMLLLTRDPDHQLDPLLVPPIIIDFFEKIRSDNKELLDEIRAARLKEQQKQEPETRDIYYQRNHYFVNFIPFGAGQFQNGDNIKGTLFATGQVAALALNITSYFMVRGLKGDDGYYSKSDAADARDWRITQYVSLGAFVALAIGGVIDAALNYEEYNVLPAEAYPKSDDQEQENEKDERPQVGFLYIKY